MVVSGEEREDRAFRFGASTLVFAGRKLLDLRNSTSAEGGGDFTDSAEGFSRRERRRLSAKPKPTMYNIYTK